MGTLPLKQMKILVGSLANHEEEVSAAAATFSAAEAPMLRVRWTLSIAPPAALISPFRR